MNLVLPAALLIAWTLDAFLGEPADAWHPVAWLGRVLAPLGSGLCRWRASIAFCGGALAWVLMACLLGGAAYGLQSMLLQWPAALATLVLACVLKPCFAWRMLRDEVAAVEEALGRSLSDGRSRVARLVSRDVRQLDAGEVRETAIETLAENLNDSVVAPLFWISIRPTTSVRERPRAARMSPTTGPTPRAAMSRRSTYRYETGGPSFASYSSSSRAKNVAGWTRPNSARAGPRPSCQ